MAEERFPLLIIYGSQTGQAKSIAEDINSKADSLNYAPELLSMDESVGRFPWSDFRLIIFVTSSTGDGDPPDNAGLLWRKLRSKDLKEDTLNHVEYALLGLGDTNYTTYLGFPKNVEKQLTKLGAKSFYNSGWADDAVGLETVVDPWIENLWPALENAKHAKTKLPDVIPPLLSENKTQEVIHVLLEPTLPVDSKQLLKDDEPAKPDKEDNTLLDECVAELASLKISVSPLNECDLKIPVLPTPFIELNFNPELMFFPEDVLRLPMPSSKTAVFQARIKELRKLTSEDAVKSTLEATLELAPTEIEYEPGDSIGVCCSNTTEEVDALLHRLNIFDKADIPFELKVKEDLAGIKSGSKLKYEIPSHLPTLATLRFVFTRCCEIRSVPRKALIRILADCASDDLEKRRLMELCSLQGSEDYTQLVRQPELNILDFLNAFPSCHPPVERLLEQLPRLLARPYSISSSPLKDPKSITFLFNVVRFPLSDGRTYERKGVATGEFYKLFQKMNNRSPSSRLAENGNSADLNLSVFLRTNSGFRLPDNTESPLILIGPGTGIAPFLGFLTHREELLKASPSLSCGPVWLFYGCRNRDQDYLFKSELERWHSIGILSRLFVSFSREAKSSEPKYVQDWIRRQQSALIKLIDKGAYIYVCGDAKNMAKDVMQAFVGAFQTGRQLSEDDAKKAVLQLQMDKRYLQDIWT